MVVNYILHLHARGEELYSARIQREYPDLHQAAFRIFGNWGNAITQAGLDYEKIRKRKKWTKERILEEIKAAYERGEDLSWHRFSRGVYSSLAYAAIKKYRFGSWENALKEAGIDYSTIRRYRLWDREKIKEEILNLYHQGIPINAKNIQAVYPALYHAARKRFSSWREAIEFSGLNYYRIAIRIKREKEEIREWLLKLLRMGEKLSDTNIRRKFPALHASACRAFGCWSNARKAIGDFTNYRRKRETQESRNLLLSFPSWERESSPFYSSKDVEREG